MPSIMIPGWRCGKEACPHHKNPWHPRKSQWERGFMRCPGCGTVESIQEADMAKYREIVA